jgi:6-phosphogluconolactonase
MLVAFRADARTGFVTRVGHFPAAKEPRGFRIDPFGRYLLAAGLQANTVTSFRIDPENGGLNKLAEYPTGEGPNWIEIVRLP